ncbi:MAG TPA: DUF4239 domain-containing protein [Methylophilaceae bacterium]|nr:DUF4239 domain-containing protein [Methylophilaceae bacterium]HQR59824.1 DUF4239 domain-containing protein [Methylophilaceae bacterium]
MSSWSVFIVTLICIIAGIVLGAILRDRLPDHHLREDSRDAIKLASGLIATLVALVLGLLVGSTKSNFDEINNQLVQSGAKIIALDRALVRYGPETSEIRAQLREGLVGAIQRIWPEDGLEKKGTESSTMAQSLGKMADGLGALTPASDQQRQFQPQLQQLVSDLLQSSLLLTEESQSSVPPVFLLVLILWLGILFMSFSLLSQHNLTSTLALIISGASISAALFLVIEMSHPFEGIIKVSDAPLLKALAIMAK